MALQQKRSQGTSTTRTGQSATTTRNKQKSKGKGKNITFLMGRAEFLEATQDEVLQEAEEEQEESQRTPEDNVPDEDEDDEGWELEEEEYLSDDWDLPQNSDEQGDEAFESQERESVEDTIEAKQAVIPAILVDREQTPTGPKLHVSLANHHTIFFLIQTLRRNGNEDRARQLENRQTKLLELGHHLVGPQQQRDFLLRQGPRRPLTTVQVARALWPGEDPNHKKGELSRLINEKGIRMPWGEVLALEDLLPSNADCMLEQICKILREHDQIERRNGKVVVKTILQVDSSAENGTSIVRELQQRWQQWLGTTEGLSAENVKHVMKRNNIPRIASERKSAYERGAAWWMETL